MSSYATVKLGKNHPVDDPRTLRLADYLRPPALPPSPPARDWGASVRALPMWANNYVGDCTACAAAAHIAIWTANAAAKALVLPDTEVLGAYSAVTGYDPNKPGSDRGAVVLDVLKYWRAVGIGGRKIRAFLQIDRSQTWEIQAAVNLFGGLYAGVALPKIAQAQIDAGQPWSAPYLPWGIAAPGSWGGHAVAISGYDHAYLTARTWGVTQRLTWGFLRTYADELWAVLSEDWIAPGGKSPSGLDLAALEADLAAL